LASNYFKIQIILLFPLTVLFVASCTNAGFSSVDKELKDTVDLALGLSVLAIATPSNELQNPILPAAQVLKNTPTTLANGASDFIIFNNATYDTGGFFHLSSPDRVTAPSNGVYFVQGWLHFSANATGARKIILYCNTDAIGSTGSIISLVSVNASSAVEDIVISTDSILRLMKGDYIKLRAYQSSGGNLDLLVDGYSQVLYIRKISD
jgi:hypothetical protein